MSGHSFCMEFGVLAHPVLVVRTYLLGVLEVVDWGRMAFINYEQLTTCGLKARITDTLISVVLL